MAHVGIRSSPFILSTRSPSGLPAVRLLCARFPSGTDGPWVSDKADAVGERQPVPSDPTQSLGAFARKSHVSLFPEGTGGFRPFRVRAGTAGSIGEEM